MQAQVVPLFSCYLPGRPPIPVPSRASLIACISRYGGPGRCATFVLSTPRSSSYFRAIQAQLVRVFVSYPVPGRSCLARYRGPGLPAIFVLSWSRSSLNFNALWPMSFLYLRAIQAYVVSAIFALSWPRSSRYFRAILAYVVLLSSSVQALSPPSFCAVQDQVVCPFLCYQ